MYLQITGHINWVGSLLIYRTVVKVHSTVHCYYYDKQTH